MNDNNKNDLKKFFIKLISITFAAIIAFNIIFNLIFADKFDNLSQVLSLNEKTKFQVLAPVVRSRKGQFKEVKTGFKLYKQLIRTVSKYEFLYTLKN